MFADARQTIASSTIRGQGWHTQGIGGTGSFEGCQDGFSFANLGLTSASFVRDLQTI